jgi:hypothetical protein
MLTKSYQTKSGPPAMMWDDYVAVLVSEWQQLLSTSPDDEKVIHRFLERHPCLLPSPYEIFGTGHHGTIFSAIVSEPELPGIRCKRPDFMLLATSSSDVVATLVEIEAPSKRWFTAKGRPTAEWMDAKNQLSDWRLWFRQPENRRAFCSIYGVTDDILRCRNLSERYVLVYGRREDAMSHADGSRKRADLPPDEIHMSFDRLAPTERLRNYPSVRIDRDSSSIGTAGYRVLEVPPTLQLGPAFAEDFAALVGLPGAIGRNRYISDARKAFLIERLEYWSAWSRRTKNRLEIIENLRE